MELTQSLAEVTLQLTNFIKLANDLSDQINAISRNIRATMRMKLHNTLIEFTPRLAKQDENQRALTKLEVFDALRKKNPAIEKLRVGLGLELS